MRDPRPCSTMPGEAVTLRELLAAARGGRADAFGQLFEVARRQLLTLADRELPLALRNKIGPSDIVQETAVDAHRDFPRFNGTTAEECFAWLRSMLRNNVVDAIRRYETSVKRGGARELSLASEQGHRLASRFETSRGLPDGSAIRREDAATLATVLARLSEDYRTVLRLRYWRGLSFVEIGAEVGRSPEAVRKLWYRAVEQLQAEMTAVPPAHCDVPDSPGADNVSTTAM